MSGLRTDIAICIRDICPEDRIPHPKEKLTFLVDFPASCTERDCAVWTEHVVCPIITERLDPNKTGHATTESVTAFRREPNGRITAKARISAYAGTLEYTAPMLRNWDTMNLGWVPVLPGSPEGYPVQVRVVEAERVQPVAYRVHGVPEEVRALAAAGAFLTAAYKLPKDALWAAQQVDNSAHLLVILKPGTTHLPEQLEVSYTGRNGATLSGKVGATRIQPQRQDILVPGVPPPFTRVLDAWRRHWNEVAESRRSHVTWQWAQAPEVYERVPRTQSSQPQPPPPATMAQAERPTATHNPAGTSRPVDPRVAARVAPAAPPPRPTPGEANGTAAPTQDAPRRTAARKPNPLSVAVTAEEAAEQRARELRDQEDRAIREQRLAAQQQKAVESVARREEARRAAGPPADVGGMAQPTTGKAAGLSTVSDSMTAPQEATPLPPQVTEEANIQGAAITPGAATPGGSRRRSRSLSGSPEEAPPRRKSRSHSRGRRLTELTAEEILGKYRTSAGGWGMLQGEDEAAYIQRIRDRLAGMSTPRTKSADSRRAKAQSKEWSTSSESQDRGATPEGSTEVPSLQLRLSQPSSGSDEAADPSAVQP